MNHRVDICKDIKRYQDALSYALSKVDYSVQENLFMLPSDINLKIRSGTVRYNNKTLPMLTLVWRKMKRLMPAQLNQKRRQ